MNQTNRKIGSFFSINRDEAQYLKQKRLSRQSVKKNSQKTNNCKKHGEIEQLEKTFKKRTLSAVAV